MTISEARRLDLYNALTEFLGEERDDTLMAYLPRNSNDELASKADLGLVDRRLDDVVHRLDGMTARLDRMVQALIAGLIAIIATLVAQSFI